MATNPVTMLGERTDWEPVEYAIAVLRSKDEILPSDLTTDAQHETGVQAAYRLLADHARAHNIAYDTIREHRTPGRTVVYFEGVRVLHARQAQRLRELLAGERG